MPEQPRQTQTRYRARLECGHVIWLRNPPIAPNVRFGCDAGQGCGYRLRWTEHWSIDSPEGQERNWARDFTKKNSEGEST